jgi:2-polyprenyl-6-methoxyphenol hydroxylase-like FAD-dependent oxidoreductase
MKVIVIGSGPAGLTFAISAARKGADVVVIEKATDPRVDGSGYTNRSFNLTINSVGRKILGGDILSGSIAVYGRAIHNFQNSGNIKYSTHVDRTKDDEVLLSIPRPVLRKNMVSVASKSKVKLMFETEAIDYNPDTGEVTVKNGVDRKGVSGDLIVIADGLWSVADKQVKKMQRGLFHMKIDPLKYITVKLDEKAARDLNLNFIHFWHNINKSSVVIGLPNKDKTISALLISKYTGIASNRSPFPNKTESIKKFDELFPEFIKLD